MKRIKLQTDMFMIGKAEKPRTKYEVRSNEIITIRVRNKYPDFYFVHTPFN